MLPLVTVANGMKEGKKVKRNILNVIIPENVPDNPIIFCFRASLHDWAVRDILRLTFEWR